MPRRKMRGVYVPAEVIRASRRALRKAIDTAGSQTALANAINEATGNVHEITQQDVWRWLNLMAMPAELAIPIERATGGAVSRGDLRPDCYP